MVATQAHRTQEEEEEEEEEGIEEDRQSQDIMEAAAAEAHMEEEAGRAKGAAETGWKCSGMRKCQKRPTYMAKESY